MTCLTYHGSCSTCHHFHKNKRFCFSLESTTHTRFNCERCNHPMFGLGGNSTQTSLASVETVNSVMANHSDPIPLRTMPEDLERTDSLPTLNDPGTESSNVSRLASHPQKKFARPNLFKNIGSKISRPFRKRASRIDRSVDNETETQSVLTKNHKSLRISLQALRREKTLTKTRLQNDSRRSSSLSDILPPPLDMIDYVQLPQLRQSKAQRQSELSLPDMRRKDSRDSLESRISLRSSVSISYTSRNGRRKRIEHRTNSVVDVRRTDLTEVLDDTSDFPSMPHQSKGFTGSEFFSSMEERGFLHGRSSSLSMLSHPKAARSVDLGADDPRPFIDPFRQRPNSVKDYRHRNSLPNVAPGSLQRSHSSTSSESYTEVGGPLIRTSEPRSSLRSKAAEDVKSNHGPERRAPHSSPVCSQISNAGSLDRSSDLDPPGPSHSFEQPPAEPEHHSHLRETEMRNDETHQDSRITRLNDKLFRLRWRCVSDPIVKLFL